MPISKLRNYLKYQFRHHRLRREQLLVSVPHRLTKPGAERGWTYDRGLPIGQYTDSGQAHHQD